MLIKKFKDQQEIIAGDNCILREFLNVNHGDKVGCRYSLAYAKVPVGSTTWKHAMKTTEVYFIIKGKGRMYINDEVEEVGIYDTVYIPPNAVQYIENIGEEELEFICIVDPAWRKEDEIVL
ncbi:MAG TPA: cupin domain-containing protein [Candidatus Magasanikbacteria bacterium]|nr:cupin domain-containing protein [Candidatus Magasanikbacteria bacterium]